MLGLWLQISGRAYSLESNIKLDLKKFVGRNKTRFSRSCSDVFWQEWKKGKDKNFVTHATKEI